MGALELKKSQSGVQRLAPRYLLHATKGSLLCAVFSVLRDVESLARRHVEESVVGPSKRSKEVIVRQKAEAEQIVKDTYDEWKQVSFVGA
jgi:hypothetical protein